MCNVAKAFKQKKPESENAFRLPSEVPGGFEPPCMVLQTSDSTTHPRHRVLLNADANVQQFFELPTIRSKIS